MVRISDILKQKGRFPLPEPPKEKKEEKLTPAQEQSPQVREEKSIFKFPQATEKEKIEEKIETVRKVSLGPEEAQRIYERALALIRDILEKVRNDVTFDLREPFGLVQEMVEHIVLRDKELLGLIINSTEDNYLYAHSVNVCIMSIVVGLALGYDRAKLNDLGLGAFLHDLGMIKVMDIVKQPRILNEKEYAQIKKHTDYTEEVLKSIKDIRQAILDIAKQNHERLGGKGYPDGLSDGQINKYAQIVSVVDVFEALTHHRPYRKAFEPHEAVKELLALTAKGNFEETVVKILINKVGIYPVGGWVELNTGEIAKVIMADDDSPLRPKVNVIFNADKEKLDEPKSIELTQQPSLFIKRSINPQELNLKLE